MDKQYYCQCCGKLMNADYFYQSHNLEKYGKNDGYLFECKTCFTRKLDNWDPETIKPCLQEVDVPWIPDEWNVLLSRYGTGRKVTGNTVFGRYLAKMRLKQHKNERWADTENIQKLAELKIRETMKRQGFSSSDIDLAIEQGKTPMPERPSFTEEIRADALPASALPDEKDLGLTEEDIMYLSVKWGKNYRQDEWVQLERLYIDMMNSYDIQTAAHRDTLKLICKTSLKANQLIDIGDK